MFASVIVDIVNSEVDKIFEYRVPDDINLNVGFRVKVPFGKGNTLREGYVIALSDTAKYTGGGLKNIFSVLSDFAALTEGQIKLAYMMRRYYHTTLAAALRLMFPSQMRGGRVRELTERELRFPLSDTEYDEAIKKLHYKDGRPKAPKQLSILKYMKKKRAVKTAELERVFPSSASARDALVKKGLLSIHAVKVFRSPRKTHIALDSFKLSEEQLCAVNTIQSTAGKYLLHGVTGSGKTEVYISIVNDCLQKGKSAIVLVPEISLTPQLVAMFTQRIGGNIAVYHSTLSAGERYDEWKRMATGDAKVVIGARSAVFAPLRNIGAIIIDEEHETSYKSDMHPKYTAHEIARMRANIEKAALVLASATPSVETYIKARNGIYQLVEMPNRLFGLSLPEVVIADMRAEVIRGNRTIFSSVLYNEICKALSSNRQVMLFLNRRGYSNFVMCRACGNVEYCDNCEVTMTYHANRGLLLCHYCGKTRELGNVCPKCQRPYLKHYGVGTQQLEEQTKLRFPKAGVLRMDLDTTRGKDAHRKIYEQFRQGNADIMIGTQMIAKGLDFSRVSLVGVIAADNSLFIPDYRSPEKTFSLLEQVSGRAGRKDPGKVVIQTCCPEHYAIRYAQNHDYTGFFEEEMRIRRSALLPPYSVFIRFLFTGENREKVICACVDFAEGFKEEFSDIMDKLLLFDTGEAPIGRIEGRYRWQVLIKTLNDGTLARLRERLYIYSDNKSYTDCVFGMEINPQSMI
ncbi:MAG: primosomal protein N' [Christensenellales bacterium]